MICIAGKNQIAIDAIKYVLEQNYPKDNIIACINKTDDGQNGWQPSYKDFCVRNEIKIVSLANLYDIQDIFFFSLEFDKIIKPELFKTKNLYNIHFSLLPAYKGMFTSILPILFGEEYSGVTLHYIDRGIDTGDIIDQIKFNLPDDCKAKQLYDLFLLNGSNLFKKNFNKILEGNITSNAQSSRGASYFSRDTINFTDININLKKTASEIRNQINAFVFREYQLPMVFGVSITHTRITTNKSNDNPGRIIEEESDYILINTIDYDIILYKDKLENILQYCQHGEVKKIIEYSNLGYDLKQKNKKGWDALIVAAYFEQLSCCEYLLNYGVSPNSININGTSVLMYAMASASKSNNIDVMKLLINNGADIDHEDYSGKTVKDYSVKYGNPKIINFLKNI